MSDETDRASGPTAELMILSKVLKRKPRVLNNNVGSRLEILNKGKSSICNGGPPDKGLHMEIHAPASRPLLSAA